MNSFLSEYSVLNLLGEGTYGKVHLAVDKVTKKQVAVKHIPFVDEDEAGSMQAVRELNLLHSLQHRNIISLIDLKMIKNNILIITEYCEYDLRTIIRDTSTRNFVIIHDTAYLMIMFQIIEAVKFIHAAGVIHRDIKPANILLKSNLEVKLCDFGMSRVEADIDGDKEVMTEYMVTRWYRAPELVLNPGKYGKAQDIWAVGCTLSELINRAPLFPGKDTVHQLQLIVQVMGTPTARDLNFDMPPTSRRFLENLHSDGEAIEVALSQVYAVDPNLCNLMAVMLQFNPNRRVTAEEAVSDPMFAHLRKEAKSEVPVPISWRTYHEALSSIQDASSDRSRIRAIRNCVRSIQEDLGRRVIEDSSEGNGARVEASAVQASSSAEDYKTYQRQLDWIEVGRVEDTTRVSSLPPTSLFPCEQINMNDSNNLLPSISLVNVVDNQRMSSCQQEPQAKPRILPPLVGNGNLASNSNSSSNSVRSSIRDSISRSIRSLLGSRFKSDNSSNPDTEASQKRAPISLWVRSQSSLRSLVSPLLPVPPQQSLSSKLSKEGSSIQARSWPSRGRQVHVTTSAPLSETGMANSLDQELNNTPLSNSGRGRGSGVIPKLINSS